MRTAKPSLDRSIRLREPAPGQLEIREGGGCLSVFGLPFFGAGVFVLMASLGVGPIKSSPAPEPWAPLAMFAMGLIFTAVGGALVFGRSRLFIDKATGTLSREFYLLFFPVFKKIHYLSEYEAVTLTFVAGDSDTSDSYPVKLKPRPSAPEMKICSSTEYSGAFAHGMKLAAFLGFKLEDSSTGATTVIDPHRPLAALKDRLRERAERCRLAPAPATPRAEVTEEEGALKISIPHKTFGPEIIVALIVPAAIVAFVAPGGLEFFRKTNTPEFVQYAFGGFFLLLFLVLPVGSAIMRLLTGLGRRTVVTVSAASVTIDEKDTFRSRPVTIAADDVLDVDLGTRQAKRERMENEWAQKAREPKAMASRMPAEAPAWLAKIASLVPAGGVIIKSRQGIFSFAAGLSDEEITWLYARVIGKLTQ